uniref:Trehalase n=1 Tax=Setaria digitata TaxID=48799 RepID=A0A915Q1Z2_9BILA
MEGLIYVICVLFLNGLRGTQILFIAAWNEPKPAKEKVVTLVDVPVEPNCSQPVCLGPLSQIYCSGKLIHTTWMFGMQGTCPGNMMLKSPEHILEQFNNLTYPLKRGQFQKFCAENFANISYLRQATLVDWTELPGNIRRIHDASLKKFARKLNDLWKVLAREFVEQVHQTPYLFPVLPVPNAFIVPGGSFQIYFYWDSYWINKGLLFSNMSTSVRQILENLASVVRFHGYIPNSGSVQLSRRSHPPLFTQMVADYYGATGNRTLLKEMIPWMDQEMLWWMKNRAVNVKLRSGQTYQLYQYRALSSCPRPENYLTDLNNGLNGIGDPEFIWSSIASACESGLDFSTRWFAHQGKYADTKNSIRTNNIIPVDLNVFMAWNFDVLTDFHKILGKSEKAAEYRKMYKKLRETVNEVFWSENNGAWFDYDLAEQKLRSGFYPSNVFPLLLGGYDARTTQKVLHYLLESGVLNFKDLKISLIKYLGGIPVSLNNASREQWDYPNGWPPLTHLFVESLRSSGDKELTKIAEKVAWKFIRTTYNGMMNPIKGMDAACWEKYDIRYDDGRPGLGGEYPVQQGFGWTIGAVLDLIYKYGIRGQNTIPKTKLVDLDQLSTNEKQLVFMAFVLGGSLLFWLLTVFVFPLKKVSNIKNEELQLVEAVRLIDNEW